MISQSPKMMESSENFIWDLMQESSCKEWADIMKSLFSQLQLNVTQNKSEKSLTQLTLSSPTSWTDSSVSIPTWYREKKVSFHTLKTWENWTEIFLKQFCLTTQFIVSGTKSTMVSQFFHITRSNNMILSCLKLKITWFNWSMCQMSENKTRSTSSWKSMSSMWMPKLSSRSFIWGQLRLFEHWQKIELANNSLIFFWELRAERKFKDEWISIFQRTKYGWSEHFRSKNLIYFSYTIFLYSYCSNSTNMNINGDVKEF